MRSVLGVVAVISFLVTDCEGARKYIKAECTATDEQTFTLGFMEAIQQTDTEEEKLQEILREIMKGHWSDKVTRLNDSLVPGNRTCTFSAIDAPPAPPFQMPTHSIGARSNLCEAQTDECNDFLHNPAASLFGYFQGCYAARHMASRDPAAVVTDIDLMAQCYDSCQECDYAATRTVDYMVDNAPCDCTVFRPESLDINHARLTNVCLKTCHVSKEPGQPVDSTGTRVERNPWSAVISSLQGGTCNQDTVLTSVFVLSRRLTIGPLSACLAALDLENTALTGTLTYVGGTTTAVKKARKVADTTEGTTNGHYAVYVNAVIRRYPDGVTPIALPNSNALNTTGISGVLVYHTTDGDVMGDVIVDVQRDSQAELFCVEAEIDTDRKASGIGLVVRSPDSYQLLGLYTGESSTFLSVASFHSELETVSSTLTKEEMLADATALRIAHAVPAAA